MLRRLDLILGATLQKLFLGKDTCVSHPYKIKSIGFKWKKTMTWHAGPPVPLTSNLLTRV